MAEAPPQAGCRCCGSFGLAAIIAGLDFGADRIAPTILGLCHAREPVCFGFCAIVKHVYILMSVPVVPVFVCVEMNIVGVFLAHKVSFFI